MQLDLYGHGYFHIRKARWGRQPYKCHLLDISDQCETRGDQKRTALRTLAHKIPKLGCDPYHVLPPAADAGQILDRTDWNACPAW